MTLGFDGRLYFLPFDHRGSMQTKMFGWKGAQTAEIAVADQILPDGLGIPAPVQSSTTSRNGSQSLAEVATAVSAVFAKKAR